MRWKSCRGTGGEIEASNSFAMRPLGRLRWRPSMLVSSGRCCQATHTERTMGAVHATKGAVRKGGRPTAAKSKGPLGTAKPALLAGGNPQIAKADGDAPVQAYIAAMPGWKSDIGRRLDTLIVRTVPGVCKAVKWNSPFYGIEGRGWFFELPYLHELREGDLLPRHVAATGSARRQGQGRALDRHPRGRSRRDADDDVDPAGGRPARLG